MASLKGRLTAELFLLFQKMDATGQSKLEDKMKAAREGRPFNYYYQGKIYSYSTKETYKPIVKNFVHWCVDNYPIQNLRDIKHGMFRDYVQKEFSHLKANTVKTRLAAISKFGEGIGKSESFHRISKQVQQTLPVDKVSRPTYKDLSQALQVSARIAESNPRYALAFNFQLETACRICEIERLRLNSLQGIVQEGGCIVGLVKLDGKGGRERVVKVSEKTYWGLDKALSEKAKLIDYDSYRSSVYQASKQVGLRSGGTHKARRFSVQDMVKSGYKQLRDLGLSSHEAREEMLHEANRQLGHSPDRTSTTNVYLRG
jgi:integrase